MGSAGALYEAGDEEQDAAEGDVDAHLLSRTPSPLDFGPGSPRALSGSAASGAFASLPSMDLGSGLLPDSAFDATAAATEAALGRVRRHYDAIGACVKRSVFQGPGSQASAGDASTGIPAWAPVPQSMRSQALAGSLRAAAANGSANEGALHPPVDMRRFHPRTVELLASVRALRHGLQECESDRRARNAMLSRDPADTEQFTWALGLPGGSDSPFPV
jgi:hypothetical protein